MRKIFSNYMKQVLQSDSKNILFLGDIGVGSFLKEVEDESIHVYNMGIAEQAMVSVAAGFSLAGFNPTIHTISNFMINRAFEQIKIDFCYQGLKGNLVSVGGSFDYANLGTTHHCPEDILLLSSMPTIELFIPGNSSELLSQLKYAQNNDKLSYFRLSSFEHEQNLNLKPGEIINIRKGTMAEILAIGPMLDFALKACEGLDVTLNYCNSLNPIDLKHFTDYSIRKPLIIIEPYLEGSSHYSLSSQGVVLNYPIFSFGFSKNFYTQYGSFLDALTYFKLDSGNLRKRIQEAVNG